MPSHAQSRRGYHQQQPFTTAQSVSRGGGENSLSATNHVKAFVSKHFFLIGLSVAIISAYGFPSLGAKGGILKPELTVDLFAVSTIFLLNGLALPSRELAKAALDIRLNGLIQFINLVLVPFLAIPLCAILRASSLIEPSVVDGLLAMACLPTTVNMCIVLTQSASGNVAVSLFNAVLGNMLGVFVTPLAIFTLLGTNLVGVSYLQVMAKLSKKVLLPVVIGQLLRGTKLAAYRARHKKVFGRVSEVLLLSIVYTTFCDTFVKGYGFIQFQTLAFLFALLPLCHLIVFRFTLAVTRLPVLKLGRDKQVAAAFVSSHKTLAFGVPLLKTLFQGHPNLALICAPLLIIHPLQLLIGSTLVPSLKRYVEENNPDE